MSADRAATAIVVMALASGCASTIYEGKYSWNEGWRKGVIEEVGGGAMRDKLAENPPAEVKERLRRCQGRGTKARSEARGEDEGDHLAGGA